jgi:hypothetical protein
MADLSTQIETAAAAPAEGTVDGVTRKSHPLPDQIAADKYLKNAAAVSARSAASAGLGIKLQNLVPPGTD